MFKKMLILFSILAIASMSLAAPVVTKTSVTLGYTNNTQQVDLGYYGLTSSTTVGLYSAQIEIPVTKGGEALAAVSTGGGDGITITSFSIGYKFELN